MRQDTFISKMDDLQRWFELNQPTAEPRPFFTIYRGYEAKSDRIIYRNSEISDSDKAWELLEEVLDAHSDSGGSFRIFITNKPGHNNGMTTLVKFPNPNPATSGVAGIAGVQGMWGIHGDPKTMIEEEVNRRVEMYELRKEMEDLKAEKDSRIGAIDRFFENLVERPEMYQLVQHLGMKLLSGMGGMMPPTQRPQPGIQGMPATDDANDEGYDYERIEPALDRLKTVFPDTEGTLERLAVWAAENPEMAQSLLINLPQ